jgi:hypothetical protein
MFKMQVCSPTRFQFFSRGTETAKLGEEPRNGVVRPCNIEKMRPQKDSEEILTRRVNADTQTMPATVSPLS